MGEPTEKGHEGRNPSAPDSSRSRTGGRGRTSRRTGSSHRHRKETRRKRALLVLGILAGVLLLGGAGIGGAYWYLVTVRRNPEPYMQRAMAQLEKGNLDACMNEFRGAVRNARDSARRGVLIQQLCARLLETTCPREEAAERFRLVISLQVQAVQVARESADVDAVLRILDEAATQTAIVELWVLAKETAERVLEFRPNHVGASMLESAAAVEVARQRRNTASLDFEQLFTDLDTLAGNPDLGSRPLFVRGIAHLVHARSLRLDARSAEAEEELESCRTLAQRLVEEFPEDPQAGLDAIRLHMNLGDMDAAAAEHHGAAVAILRRTAALPALAENAGAALVATELALQLAEQSESKQESEEILTLAEKMLEAVKADTANRSVTASFLLARIRESQDKVAEAEGLLDALLMSRTIPVSPQALVEMRLYRLGLLQLTRINLRMADRPECPEDEKRERLAVAEGHIARLHREVPDDFPYLIMLDGWAALLRGHHSHAVEKLVQSREGAGRFTWEMSVLLGRALTSLEEWSAAARFLEPGYEFDVSPPETRERCLYLAALCYQRNLAFPQAEKLLTRLLEKRPDHRNGRLLLANQLTRLLLVGGTRQEERDTMLKRIENVLEPLIQDHDMDAQLRLADACVNSGKPQRAIAILQEALTGAQDSPDRVRVALPLIRLLTDGGQTEEAAKLLAQLVEGVPDTTVATLVRAEYGAGKDPLNDSLATLLRVAYTEDSVRRTIGLSQFYRSQEAKGNELDTLVQAMIAHPRDTVLIALTFDRAVAKDNLDVARKMLDAATKIPEMGLERTLMKARIAFLEGDMRTLSALARSGTERWPYSSDLWQLTAIAHRDRNSIDAEREALLKALACNATDASTLRRLFQLADLNGEHQQALRFLAKAVALDRSQPLLEAFLAYQARYGDPQEALRIRKLLAATTPQNFANKRGLADLLFTMGKHDDALEVLESLLQAEPRNVANHIAMARGLALSQSPEKAKQYLTNLLATLSPPPSLPDKLAVAETLVRTGFADDGFELAKSLLPEEKPETRRVTRFLASLRLLLGEHREALDLFDALPEAMQQEPEIRVARAQCFFGLKELDRARALVDGVMPQLAGNPNVLLFLLQVALAQDDRQTVLTTCDRVLKIDADLVMPRMVRARLLLRDPDKDKRAQAANDLEHVRRLQPTNPEPLELLTQWSLNRGDRPLAIRRLQRLIEISPDQPRYLVALSSLLLEAERYQELTEHMQGWRDRFPGNAELLTVEARLLRSQGRVAEAVTRFREAFESTPTESTLLNYADALLLAGQAAQAERVLGNVGADLEASPLLLSLRGRAEALLEKQDQAAETFQNAIRASAQSPGHAMAIAARINRSLKPEEILRLFPAPRPAEDPTGVIRVLRADAYAAMGQTQRTLAIGVLESVIQSIPKEKPVRIEALFRLSNLLHMDGRHQRSLDLLRELQELTPDRLHVLNNMAYQMGILGVDLDEAAAIARQAADQATDPQHKANCLDTLGFIHMKSGSSAQAREAFQDSLRVFPLASTHLHFAELLKKANQREQALQHIQSAEELADQKGILDDIAAESKALRQALEALAPAPPPEEGGLDEI